jgi:hypothetical protein
MNNKRYVLVFFLLFSFICINRETTHTTKKTTIINNTQQEERKKKTVVSFRKIALALEKSRREAESKIFLKALDSDSIRIIQNEYSSMVQFEKPIKFITDTEEIKNSFIILDVEIQETYNLFKIVKPYVYIFSANKVKGGIGWEIISTNSTIEITSIEF